MSDDPPRPGDQSRPADSGQIDEVLELAGQQCQGALEAAGLARLEELIAGDVQLRRHYLQYVFLHAHLAQVDEVVGALYQPELPALMGCGEAMTPHASEIPTVTLNEKSGQPRRPRYSRQRMLAAALAVCVSGLLLAPVLLVLLLVPPPGNPTNGIPKGSSIATLTQSANAQWADEVKDLQPGQPLGPGTLRLTKGRAEIAFRRGGRVALEGPATIGLESEEGGSLFAGRLWARLDEPNQSFILNARNVRIVDKGTEFGVHVHPQGETEIHCLAGKIEVQSRERQPLFYWNFDDPKKVVDELSQKPARVGAGATAATGLVGAGALSFDNTAPAMVNVGNGGGTRLDAGGFGVSCGLTIEALVTVKWTGEGASTGKPFDYDEIFRKEDGVYRILLSFQNDNGAHQRNVPEIKFPVPTLSFGLHLAGDGYSELEVPLDGQQGRPTLDALRNKMHHIVATYDSWTGAKAIYVDGVLCQQAKFASGSLIQCGGPSDAIIGNMMLGNEPYNGAIDEVAIYDFALGAAEVAKHWQNVQSGLNYFGNAQQQLPQGDVWKSIALLSAGHGMRFDTASGTPLGDATGAFDTIWKE